MKLIGHTLLLEKLKFLEIWFIDLILFSIVAEHL